MARSRPRIDIDLYSGSGSRTTVYPGFGRVDAMSELFDRRDTMASDGTNAEDKPGSQIVRVSKVALDSTVAWPYGDAATGRHPNGVIFIPEPFGQVKPTPLFDLTQHIDLNYFEPIGKWTYAGRNDYWEDWLTLPGLPQPVIHMTRADPLGTGEYTGLRSLFKLPWNPVMCFGLWRADPPDIDVTSRSYTLSAIAGRPHEIVINGADIPPVGTTVIVCDTDGACISTVVTGVTWSSYYEGYIISFSPPLEGERPPPHQGEAREAATISWSSDLERPVGESYWTRFYFGVTSERAFCLEIPIRSSLRLWVRDEVYTGNRWRLLRSEREMSSSVANAGTEQLRAGRDVHYNLVWVAFTGHGIAVSTDGFESDVAFWSTTVDEVSALYPYGHHLQIKRGYIEFHHNAGQWAVAWLPINHPEQSWLDGPVMALPFDYAQYVASAIAPHRYPVVALADGFWAYDREGAPITSSVVLECTYGQPYSRIPPSGYGFEWRARMNISVQSDTFDARGMVSEMQRDPKLNGTELTYTHAVVPEIHRVRFHAWPGVRDNDKGVATEVTSARRIQISRNANDIGATGSLVLDNMPEADNPRGKHYSTFFSGYRPRYVEIGGQWLDADGTPVPDTDYWAYCGDIGIPSLSMAGPDNIFLVSELQDASLRALDSTSDGKVPAFDTWYVSNAVLWILDHLGIAVGEIEETGLRLNNPLPGGDPYWYAEDGRSWRDVLQEICLYDYGAAFWIGEDGLAYKGCPYCRYARTASDTDPHYAPLHVNLGWRSPGCWTRDLARTGNAYGVDKWITLGSRYVNDIPTGTPEALTYEATSFELEGLAIEEEYFNHVRVKGAKRMNADDPITLDFVDWASVHGDTSALLALGYRKTYAATFEWADKISILQRIGLMLYQRHRSVPMYLQLRIPYSPEIGIGSVCGVYGRAAEMVAANAQRWRVVAYSHEIGDSPITATTVRLRYLGPLE